MDPQATVSFVSGLGLSAAYFWLFGQADKEQIAKLQQQLKSKSDDCVGLEKQLERVRQGQQDLIDENDRLKVSLTEKASECREIKDKFTSAEVEMKELRRGVDDWKKACSDAQEKYCVCVDELKICQSQLKTREIFINDQKMNISALEEQMKSIQTRLSETIVELDRKCKDSQKEIETYRFEIKQLTEQLKSAHEEFKQKENHYTNVISEMGAKLKEIEAEHKSDKKLLLDSREAIKSKDVMLQVTMESLNATEKMFAESMEKDDFAQQEYQRNLNQLESQLESTRSNAKEVEAKLLLDLKTVKANAADQLSQQRSTMETTHTSAVHKLEETLVDNQTKIDILQSELDAKNLQIILLDKKVWELNEQLSSLGSQLQKSNEQNEVNVKQFESEKSALKEFEQLVTKLETEVETLKLDIVKQSEILLEKDTTIASLNYDLESMRDSETDKLLAGRIAQLESETEQLQSTISTLRSENETLASKQLDDNELPDHDHQDEQSTIRELKEKVRLADERASEITAKWLRKAKELSTQNEHLQSRIKQLESNGHFNSESTLQVHEE